MDLERPLMHVFNCLLFARTFTEIDDHLDVWCMKGMHDFTKNR
jgi:hypothetical protein